MLSSSAITAWGSKQTLEARRAIFDLPDEPEKYHYWFERFSTIISLRQIFGKDVKRGAEEIPHIERILSIMHTIERVSSPGAYLVASFPLLQHLPARLGTG